MISLCYTTARVDYAKEHIKRWIAAAKDINNIEIIITIDRKFESKLSLFDNIVNTKVYINDGRPNCIDGWNLACRKSRGDILIQVSDDLIAPQNYDVLINSFLDINKAQILAISDGLTASLDFIPHSIFTRKYYNEIGYLFNSVYWSMWCDNEYTEVAKLKNVVVDGRSIQFRHYNGAFGKDEVYKNHGTNKQMEEGKIIFNKRKEEKFVNNYTPTLSILITTIYGRESYFNRLLDFVYSEFDGLDVEVLWYKDNRGEHTIGAKRNILLQSAHGKYTMFVDDDDMLEKGAIKKMLEVLETKNPDCLALHGIISFINTNKRNYFIHSITYDKYFEKDNMYLRPPNHLNPIRASIAKQFKFPEINTGEDTNWAMQICNAKVLKTEADIGMVYYFYDFVEHK